MAKLPLYYIEFVTSIDAYGKRESYYQLCKRTNGAILYANASLDYVFDVCKDFGIYNVIIA